MVYIVGDTTYKTPFDFDMALQEPVFYMMHTGINVDLEEKNRLEAEYQSRWAQEQVRLDSLVGHDLNVNSPKQVCSWLYDELGLPIRRNSEGNPTSEEAALRSLLAICRDTADKRKTPAGKRKWVEGFISIMLILKVRGVRKRLSSYLSDVDSKGKPAPKVDTDGRIRTHISVGGTETARFSHSKTLWGTGVNLATVPHELRSMYIASPGKELAELDLNRGESWIYAFLSEDPELMRIHTEGGDFHAETAAAISLAFGEPLSVEWIVENKGKDEKAYKIRFLGKKTNHASSYRMGPFKGAETVNEESDDTNITVTVGQFKKMQRLWIRKYIGIKGWWDAIERQLNDDRTLITPFGRVRTFYERWGDELFKEATAHVPQSTSVDYLNVGMLRVYKELVKKGFCGLRLLHQNHDSILIEYDEGKADEVIPEVMERMTSTVRVKGVSGEIHEITIPIEPQIGQNWGDLELWQKAA